MHPTVVAVVMSTDNATSPLAMYAHRLLACPPLMEPTRINPARSGRSQDFNGEANARA